MLNRLNKHMNQTLTINKLSISNLNVYLIIFLPISLLIGSLISNSIILLIDIIYIYEMKSKKKNYFLKDKNFYFLLIIYFYLISNSIFISSNPESVLKSFGFIRFIILAYAISYYINDHKNKILKFWLIIFLLVSFDIFFEHLFGKNILGNQSIEPTRIASFSGDELKIGGFYFDFICISLLFIKNKNKFLFIISSIIFFYISLVIGERSNFLKIFSMYLLFILLYIDFSIIKKIFLILIIFTSSFIIISNQEILKSRFYQQIFGPIIESSVNNKNYDLNTIIQGNEYFRIYNTALNIFNNNKFFGSGFKSYRIESYKIKSNSDPQIFGASTHVHQTHFEFLSELGLFGYFLILSNFIYILNENRKTGKNLINQSGVLFLLATLIPLLPSGSFFTSYTASIFWINYAFLIKRNY